MKEMKRGANVTLTREIPDLRGVVLGVQYNAGPEQVLADNIVVAAILCRGDGDALSDRHFVYFNQLASPDLSVQQLRDVMGEDQDQIEVDLLAAPAEVTRIVIVMYVNEGIAARRTLGRLKSCVIRVLNLDGNAELIRSENLAPVLNLETGLALGELFRHSGGWKFKVLGDGYANGVTALAADYGIRL